MLCPAAPKLMFVFLLFCDPLNLNYIRIFITANISVVMCGCMKDIAKGARMIYLFLRLGVLVHSGLVPKWHMYSLADIKSFIYYYLWLDGSWGDPT